MNIFTEICLGCNYSTITGCKCKKNLTGKKIIEANEKLQVKIKQLEADNKELKSDLVAREKGMRTLESKLSQSVEREGKLRECVEFYGSLDSWYSDGILHRQKIFSSDMQNMGSYNIGGKRARQCLKQITEQKENDE